MARHRGTVLVDTNVILEAHQTGSWQALAGGYTVETVEDCVTETQTGSSAAGPSTVSTGRCCGTVSRAFTWSGMRNVRCSQSGPVKSCSIGAKPRFGLTCWAAVMTG